MQQPLLINGVPMAATPSFFQVGLMDLDDAEGTGRSADGYGYRDRIRAGVRKIEMSFGLLTWAEISAQLQQVEDEYIKFTYPDPYSGKYETRTFNSGDRTAAFAVSRGNDFYWTGLKFNLVEQ